MKRIISLVLALMLVATVFVACGSKKSDNAVNVTVKLTTGSDEFYSKEVTVYADEPTVLNAVQTVMDEFDDITIVLDDEAEPTSIQDVTFGDKEYLDGDKYWDFTIGDEPFGTKGRASVAEIKEGDVITWGYMTTDEFAALEEAAE